MRAHWPGYWTSSHKGFVNNDKNILFIKKLKLYKLVNNHKNGKTNLEFLCKIPGNTVPEKKTKISPRVPGQGHTG